MEDEARARLDVADLYIDMGQVPKAIRYYLEAVQIYLDSKSTMRAKELLQKILQLDPGNAQAQGELKKLTGSEPPPAAAAAAGGGAPSGARPSGEGAPAAPAKPANPNALPPLQLPQPQPGKVLVPTPWLFRDPRYVAKAKKDLASRSIDRTVLPFDPLPKVDPQMVMIKQEQRKKADEEAARKSQKHVESSFSRGESRFGAKTDGGAKPSGIAFPKPGATPAALPAAAASTAPAPAAPQGPVRLGSLGGSRSGNQELAEQIQRRMQEKR